MFLMRVSLLFMSFIMLFSTSCSCNSYTGDKDVLSYVNPFIGNADNGHTFPGACAPFGMIQVSPETGNDSWRYCSGFNYGDEQIIGFAQTHLNGTGCSDLGDILFFPFSGDDKNGTYKSKFDKESQIAAPGYYKVKLTDDNIDVELTATQRTAHHVYTYNSQKPARMLLDLQSGVVWDQKALKSHVLHSEINMPDKWTITGHQEVTNWVKRHYFFVIKFDKAYTVTKTLDAQEGEKAKRMILDFNLKPGESVQVKVALSTVSIEGAEMAMLAENPKWEFNVTKETTQSQWRELLSQITVTGTEDQKVNFYTSLYHLYVQPNNIADIDGKYRGINDSVFVSPNGDYYSTFSLWDTYRAAHPLYTILVPKKVPGMINSMLAHQEVQGYLPIWTLWGKETFCMIANHAVPVIVDAYLKGIKGFDQERAYKAIKASLLTSHKKSDWETYDKYGYYPYDIISVESVSRTLESSYDDYCAAQMAKALKKNDDYEFFMKRANYYKALFDPSTKLMRAKDSKGNWDTPFDPFLLSHAATSGGNYTEGNAWQYTWHVQHDIKGLIELMGKETFALKLDSLFSLNQTAANAGFVLDVSGLIGQYAHGNEPSHHVAYLYNYVNQPWKTQALISEIFERFYQPKPDGLCGNDDCGQMSAWYIFSAMGFYPVDPISQKYVIGAPQMEKISIKLANGKLFTVEAKKLSKKNKYVKSVALNGKPITGFTIDHDDIMSGGSLVFVMTDKPVK